MCVTRTEIGEAALCKSESNACMDPPPRAEDGIRVLVDRLSPRGIREKGQAGVDLWAKELALFG